MDNLIAQAPHSAHQFVTILVIYGHLLDLDIVIYLPNRMLANIDSVIGDVDVASQLSLCHVDLEPGRSSSTRSKCTPSTEWLTIKMSSIIGCPLS